MLTEEQKRALAEAASFDDLQNLLQSFIDAGSITVEEGTAFYYEYAPQIQTGLPVATPTASTASPLDEEFSKYLDTQNYTAEDAETIKQYIMGFTSKVDLAKRLNLLVTKGVLKQEVGNALYVSVLDLAEPGGMELRQAAQKIETDRAQAQAENEWARETEQRKIDEETQQRQAVQKYNRESQVVRALIPEAFGMTTKPLESAVKPLPLPSMPSYEGVYEPFLAKIGAPNFRQFIESRLSSIADKTQQARSEWWKALNAPSPVKAEPLTFEDELNRYRTEIAKWGSVGKAASAFGETMGDVAFNTPEVGGLAPWLTDTGQLVSAGGLEGLASVAAGAGQTANERLGDLLALGQQAWSEREGRMPVEPEPVRPTMAEDPFKQYIEKFPFLADFMKLSPSERNYNKQTYAPRVSWRTPV